MDLITGLLAIALPALATLALTLLKNGVTVIDRLSPLVQQGIAVILAFTITKLAAVVGAPLPVDVHQWDQVAMLGLLNGLAAIGIHAVRKGK